MGGEAGKILNLFIVSFLSSIYSLSLKSNCTDETSIRCHCFHDKTNVLVQQTGKY